MSRTDKDAPNWARAINDPRRVINHAFSCEDGHWYGWMPAARVRIPCTIDDPNNDRSYRFCTYWLDDRTRFRYTEGPGTARLHSLYYGPERAAVRNTTRNLTRAANSLCDDDNLDEWDDDSIEVPVRQSRNSTWYGGYWD